MRQPESGLPSQRQLRAGELIRHALAEILQRGDSGDPVLDRASITVPEVRMSPDLRIATAYVMPLGGRDVEAILAALRRNARALRGAVARKVTLKFMPELRFARDETFDEADRIDALLRSPQVRRDLSSRDGED